MFEDCERSFWHWTTIPVGMCVIADRGIGLVHVLPAGTARAVGVDPQVGLVDLDVDVFRQERRDDHLGEGRVPAVRLVERRQPDEPVHAALRLQDSVGVVALHRERRGLEPRLLPRAGLQQVGREAALVGPAQVHAQEHLGPVLRIRPAGSGVDRDERVTGVVLSREERILLQPRELLLQGCERGGDLVGHLAVHRQQLACVLVLLCQPLVALEAARDARVLGGDLCCLGLVVPEAGLGHAALEPGPALPQLVRVKGNHGPSRAGPRFPAAAPGRLPSSSIVAEGVSPAALGCSARMSVHAWLYPGHHAVKAVSRARPHEAPRLGLTLIAASLCIFVVQLDFFALNLALPKMASELDTTTTNLQWVISGYMLATAASLIPGGRLGDIFGRKRMLIVGLAIFGLASLGAGLAPNADVVIGFRIVQGVGAGMLFPLAIAVISAAYPPERTMRAIGNAYGIGAVAMAIGPLFGGGLTALIDWRATLLVNVPVALAAIVVVAVGVQESRDTTVPRSVDLPGLIAVTLGISAITFAVDRSSESGLAETLGLGAAGVLLLVAFVVRERSAHWPLVRLDLFRNAPYVVVTLLATVANVGFVIATFGTTLYLQQVQGYTPLEAGAIFLAASLAAGAAGPLSGRLGERYDIPRTIATATVVGSAGLLVASIVAALGPYMCGLALFGLGYGIGWAMSTIGTQTVVSPERVGEASGVTLALVIGIAGLAVAAAAALIEAGAKDNHLASALEDVLRWTAIGTAVSAAILALLAARLMPKRAPATT